MYMYIYTYVLHHSQRPCVRERHSPNMSFHQTWSWSVTMITNRATSSMGTKGEGRIKLPIELIGEEACTNSNTAFPVILRASNFHDVFKEFLERESNAAPYLDIEGVTQPTVHNTPSWGFAAFQVTRHSRQFPQRRSFVAARMRWERLACSGGTTHDLTESSPWSGIAV